MKTGVTDILGIKYPIICGGMTQVGTAELAAAVSNAGGLGQISAGPDKESCKREIERTRRLTDKPFGVNIPLMTVRWTPGPLIDTVIEEKVLVVSTSGGDPAIYTRRLKAAGVKVIHVVASVRQARRAESAGVDIIVAEGVESGGACAFDDVTTLVLVPLVVDVVKCPVVAAGGIGDGRGMVAAFALGAEGVQMGTRFIASTECVAHPAFKEMILKAGETDTVLTARTVGPMRCLKNKMTEEALKIEYTGASREKLLEFFGLGRTRLAAIEGDVEQGSVLAGEISGMINSIMSSADIIQSLVQGWGRTLERLNHFRV